MRVLVTGGCGFIGARLVEKLLSLGHSVVVLDNLSPQIHGPIPNARFSWKDSSDVRMVCGDIRSPEAVDSALNGIDAIAHLAAETGTGQSMYEITRYSGVNSQGTALLLERVIALRLPLARFVLAGSRSVYGEGSYICPQCSPDRPQTPCSRGRAELLEGRWDPVCRTCGGAMRSVPTREDAPIRPASIYAATKMAQEDLVRIACEAAGIPAMTLRFQNVYGEGQSLNNPYTGIISIFSTRIRCKLSLPIYEDGKESRDFVHVADVVDALIDALLRPFSGYGVFNIGSGRATSVMEVAQILGQALGYGQEPVVTGDFRLGDIRHCHADISAAREGLGFAPNVSIEDGLRRFVRWALSEALPEDQLDRTSAKLKAHGLMAQAAR